MELIITSGCHLKKENSSNPPVEISEDSTVNLFNYSYKDLESNSIYTKNNAQSNYAEYSINSPQLDCSIDGKNDIFHCVKHACSIAGAEWIDSEKFCQCPAGQVWTITPESKCINFHSFYKHFNRKTDSNKDIFSYQFLNELGAGYFWTGSDDSIKNINKNKKIKWNPSTFSYESFRLRPITRFKNKMENEKFSPELVLTFLNSLFATTSLSHNKDNDFVEELDFLRIKYVSSDDHIYKRLIGLDLPDKSIDFHDYDLNKSYQNYLSKNLTSINNEEYSYYRLGCLILCRTVVKSISNDGIFEYQEYTSYFSGNFTNKTLLVFKADSLLPIAAFNISQHGELLYYATLRSQSDLKNSMSINIDLYNPSEGLIFSYNYYLENISHYEKAFEENIKKFKVKVITSENTGFLLTNEHEQTNHQTQKIVDQTIIGPLYSSTFEKNKSLSGWVKAKSIDQFSSNADDFTTGFFLLNSQYKWTRHSILVNSLLLSENSSIGLIPADIYSWSNAEQKNNQQIFSSLKKNGVRIVNNSSGMLLDKSECEKEYKNYSTSFFLFINAAGNDHDRTNNSFNKNCPIIVLPSKKQIVVGSFDEPGKPSEWSNLNPTFVDILADGYFSFESETKKEHGTSFSAPRVTHTAALIQMKYPNLSNDQIRLSILMSATYNKDYPVKSRGHLNQDDALIFADKLNQKLSSRYPEIYKTADFETDILLFPDDNNLEDMKNIITEFYSPVSKTLVKTKLIILDKVIK